MTCVARKEASEEQSMISRRALLAGAGAVALIAGWRGMQGSGEAAPAAAPFEIEKPDAEWRKLLTPAQYDVLRQHGTERPFSSPLDHEKRKGTFACAGCDLPDAVGTSVDRSFFMKRTEVHCRRCGGHLGHVFDDGPQPTGLRYCMNGVALKFTPAPATAS
jgi:peptide-methionine (R)-S-oxide reductase